MLRKKGGPRSKTAEVEGLSSSARTTVNKSRSLDTWEIRIRRGEKNK